MFVHFTTILKKYWIRKTKNKKPQQIYHRFGVGTNTEAQFQPEYQSPGPQPPWLALDPGSWRWVPCIEGLEDKKWGVTYGIKAEINSQQIEQYLDILPAHMSALAEYQHQCSRYSYYACKERY